MPSTVRTAKQKHGARKAAGRTVSTAELNARAQAKIRDARRAGVSKLLERAVDPSK